MPETPLEDILTFVSEELSPLCLTHEERLKEMENVLSLLIYEHPLHSPRASFVLESRSEFANRVILILNRSQNEPEVVRLVLLNKWFTKNQ